MKLWLILVIVIAALIASLFIIEKKLSGSNPVRIFNYTYNYDL